MRVFTNRKEVERDALLKLPNENKKPRMSMTSLMVWAALLFVLINIASAVLGK